MAIVKMKRFRLIALAQDRANLFSRLQRLGCVEVSETEGFLSSPEWANLLHKDNSASGDVKTKLSQVKLALDALKKYAPEKSGLFYKRSDISAKEFFDADTLANSLHIANVIGESLSAISRLNTAENRLLAAKASLEPWKTLDVPLHYKSTENVNITLGVCPAVVSIADLQAGLAEIAPLSSISALSEDAHQHYLLVLSHTSQTQETNEFLKTHSFSVTQFKDMNGTAAEEIDRIQEEMSAIVKDRMDEEENISLFADARPALHHCLDRLTQDLELEMARENLLTDGTIVFLEGWARADDSDRLQKLLDSYSCAYTLDDPTKEETPPTLLKNPKWMSCMNMVTEMYSLPSYHTGIDPNPLIFGFFILFFGFMFADIGYGIILAVLSWTITKKYRPKNTIGYMFNLGIYLGISTAFFGALTGAFFGDSITVFSSVFLGKDVALPFLINPLSDPMTVLGISLILGVIQLITGQCVHMYMKARDGEAMDGILNVVPWWLFFASIAVYSIYNVSWAIWAGLALLVLTQGRKNKSILGKFMGGIASLYDLTSWLSDVLSYCRLMALMLATSVIASVMNILGSLPGSIIAFVIIFIIGHVFNIGVNIIGTYVHAARLQYLEYFSKFYEAGGVPFRPLKYRTKYVDITEEEI